MTIAPWLPLGIRASKTKGAMAAHELASLLAGSRAFADQRMSPRYSVGASYKQRSKFPQRNTVDL